MENYALVEELSTLVKSDDALSISRDVNDLKTRFDDFLLELERREQVAELEAHEKGEEYEPKDYRSLRDAFYEIYNEYKDRRKHEMDARQAFESENLKRKRSLIERLREIIQNEENIGAAYNAFKEIQEEWGTIGDIAREKRDEIQRQYSNLREDFFYHMKIYRELKDHDLKRNSQLKQEVIQQLEALKNNDSIKDIESMLKKLQNEWEEIGPVVNEEWENLKETYWEQVRAIYEKINLHYEERRSSLVANLEKKKELLDETKTILDNTTANTSTKQWEAATEQLIAIQERWKQVGFGPRKENEEIWQEFRGYCDEFFAQKKAFYRAIQEQFEHVAAEKRKLIEQANALKDSTDWKATSDKLVQLQKKWKTSGHAGQKLEQKLWLEFRAACDTFFNARQKHFEDQDKELEVNLSAKQELIKEIESYIVPEDKKQALADLKEFTNRFNAIGKVPLKEKDAIYKAYKTALDQHYSQLKLEGEEKEKVLFQAHIETLAANPDAKRMFSRERSDIRQQIEHLKSDILQYENNLGFFAKSKGADALRKEVEGKINAAKNKIESLKRKLKQIPNE